MSDVVLKEPLKDALINTKVTKAEKKLIEKHCKKVKVTKSHFLRFAMLQAIELHNLTP